MNFSFLQFRLFLPPSTHRNNNDTLQIVLLVLIAYHVPRTLRSRVVRGLGAAQRRAYEQATRGIKLVQKAIVILGAVMLAYSLGREALLRFGVIRRNTVLGMLTELVTRGDV